jgi:hypothetical protein
MAPVALLDSLTVRGFVVDIDGDALTVAPFTRLTDSECADIRACKNDIMLLLRLPGATFDGELWEWRGWTVPTKATGAAYGRRHGLGKTAATA